MAPAERADVIVDFSKYSGKTLIFTTGRAAPVPAFDPRVDYYTGDPDQTFGVHLDHFGVDRRIGAADRLDRHLIVLAGAPAPGRP